MPDNTTNDDIGLAGHGSGKLSAVHIDAYNTELQDSEGFIGDRASGRAFRAILEEERERIRKVDDADPIGETPSKDISKKKLDKVIAEGDPEAAGVVLGTIEEFAQEFATVIRRFLGLPEWKNTQRIVVGGGLRRSRIGELAIGRTAVLLKPDHAIELVPIRYDPDEAGLIGCVHLAPSWIFSGHDSILAVDIGGSNIRLGVVELNTKKAPDLSRCSVAASDLWRHADEEPDRAGATERLVKMVKGMIKEAEKKNLKLAPFIGIGCPGLIREDGSIAKGGQNLPGGNWEDASFNLPAVLRDALPAISDHRPVVLMHNDAVVQGLSEVPFMRDVERWGVMTIGTGLGNARFSNRG